MPSKHDYSFLTKSEAILFLKTMSRGLKDMAEERGFVDLHLTLEVASKEVKLLTRGQAVDS